MNDSVKYTVYPAKQRAPFMLIVAVALVTTAILALVFWSRQPAVKDGVVPPVAPMVPNPAPLPNPH